MIKFRDYNDGLKIISVALKEEVKNDLGKDNLETLYIDKDGVWLYPKGILLNFAEGLNEFLNSVHDYDVFEVWPNGTLHKVYDSQSIDNYFFVTGLCNSNCWMCPSPDAARQNSDKADIDRLIEIARHIPSDTPHLTITGGEPFMAGRRIFEFFSFLKEKYENTEFLLLTNGRIFAVRDYLTDFVNTMPPSTLVGIPIHGSTPEKHDNITRTKNSFDQSVIGIKRLIEHEVKVELRIVVSRLNIDDFVGMAELIINEMPEVMYVSIMAQEMTGNAHLNRNRVWIEYGEAFERITEAIDRLIEAGIDVRIYNFPLCTVQRKYWTLCEKSISPTKVKYAEVCNECGEKDACGGVFAGSYLLEEKHLRSVV